MSTKQTLHQFEAFYRAEYSGVVHLVAGLTKDRWRAEEIAQEAFIRAHQQWSRVAVMEAPVGWVRRVALNLAYSLRRRIAAEVRALARVGPHTAESEIEPEHGEFWDVVRRLPRRQAQIIALYYISDLSVNEVAQTLNVAPGTVKAQLHSARSRMRRQLIAKGWELE